MATVPCTIPHQVLYKLCSESEFTARDVICHLTFYFFAKEVSIHKICGVKDAFKNNRARKNMIPGGAAPLICVTVD
jgi:hypothetical protein